MKEKERALRFDTDRSDWKTIYALIELHAAIKGRRSKIPQAVVDRRFYHGVYHGKLEAHQEKRADKRTYDSLVFYGSA